MSRHLFGDDRYYDDVGRRLDLWAVALENAVDTLNKTLDQIKELQRGGGDGRLANAAEDRRGDHGGGGA